MRAAGRRRREDRAPGGRRGSNGAQTASAALGPAVPAAVSVPAPPGTGSPPGTARPRERPGRTVAGRRRTAAHRRDTVGGVRLHRAGARRWRVSRRPVTVSGKTAVPSSSPVRCRGRGLRGGSREVVDVAEPFADAFDAVGLPVRARWQVEAVQGLLRRNTRASRPARAPRRRARGSAARGCRTFRVSGGGPLRRRAAPGAAGLTLLLVLLMLHGRAS